MEEPTRELRVGGVRIAVAQAQTRLPHQRYARKEPRVLLSIADDYDDTRLWPELTPDEAERLAEWLREVAAEAREAED
ncbi:MAG TPA: hypothetical protein VFL91_02320 [Thermomicrobiales bacterium]|nr:hypothetical protein [Thermomicrobiales bacterium]